MTVFVAATALTEGEVFRRVEIGLLVGSAASMVVFWIALRHRLKAGVAPNEGSVLEAFTDMPFET